MTTASVSRRAAPVCFFSVVRYVADPVRDEAKNIGILVVAPDVSFAGARFSLSKLHLPAGSDRLRYLKETISGYQARLPTGTVREAAVTRRAFLDRLHEEATNVIQFTAPSVAIGDPRQVLDEVYRERVAESVGGWRGGLSRSDAMTAFTRVFKREEVPQDAIVPTPWVRVGDDRFVFDLGVRNGAWVGVLEVMSFRKADTLRVEQQGAWFAQVFPLVRDRYDIPGHVIVEPPKGGGEDVRRYDRVRIWSEAAGAIAHGPDALEDVAAEFARRLAVHPAFATDK